MIEKIVIPERENFESIDIELGQYNLFIGKNGTGKSYLMKLLLGRDGLSNNIPLSVIKNGDDYHTLGQQKYFNDIKYLSEFRVTPDTSTKNLQVSTPQSHPLDLVSVWRNREFIKKFNGNFKNMFENRSVEADINSEKGAHVFYQKAGKRIDPSQDSFGALSIMKLMSDLYSTKFNTFFIEEPSFSFHMSLTARFLKHLLEEPSLKTKQFIFSSQDIVFILEFIKLYQKRDDFKIFKFEENKGKLIVTEVTELEAIGSNMSDEFPTLQDINLLKTIFMK